MKFLYEYRTRDNAVHSGVVVASTRDAAYATLKARGVRPSRLTEAPGFLNALFGKGKRWLAIGVLGVLLVILAVALLRQLGQSGRSENRALSRMTPRHQIYGDPAIMEPFERGDFSSVFVEPGDYLLAWFAQPGKLMCPPDANVAICTSTMASNLSVVAGLPPLSITADDSREVIELKQIVNGMRDELRTYLADGTGTPVTYWRRLRERQEEENAIYERTRRELEADHDPVVRQQRNEALRRLGLRTIPRPRSGE